jgi:hypothetical protein
VAESALPYPTPTRLRLADAIAANQVKHYHWVKPWSCDIVRDANVTARVAELVAAGLAEIPAAGGNLPESFVRLTPDGMAWVTRARTSKISTEGEGPGSTSPEPGPPPVPMAGRDFDIDGQPWPEPGTLYDESAAPLHQRVRESGHSTEPGPALPWQGFNPAHRVVRCGQSSAHGPHFMDHGPDQPRNCPGTGRAAWDAYQRWATERGPGHSTEDGAA